jgi:hypothetical protein
MTRSTPSGKGARFARGGRVLDGGEVALHACRRFAAMSDGDVRPFLGERSEPAIRVVRVSARLATWRFPFFDERRHVRRRDAR